MLRRTALFYLPVLLFNSCITATVVPLFVEEREKYSLKHSNRFASNALNLFITGVAGDRGADVRLRRAPIVTLIFRFDAEGIALTVRLTRIMMLGLAFNVASIVLSSPAQRHGKIHGGAADGFPAERGGHPVVRCCFRAGWASRPWRGACLPPACCRRSCWFPS